MPYKIEPNGDGTVRVVNAITGKIHAKRTSESRAKKQVRLMEAYDNNPGWRGHNDRRGSRLWQPIP